MTYKPTSIMIWGEEISETQEKYVGQNHGPWTIYNISQQYAY